MPKPLIYMAISNGKYLNKRVAEASAGTKVNSSWNYKDARKRKDNSILTARSNEQDEKRQKKYKYKEGMRGRIDKKKYENSKYRKRAKTAIKKIEKTNA